MARIRVQNKPDVNKDGFHITFKEAKILTRKRRYKNIMYASLLVNLLLLGKIFLF